MKRIMVGKNFSSKRLGQKNFVKQFFGQKIFWQENFLVNQTFQLMKFW